MTPDVTFGRNSILDSSDNIATISNGYTVTNYAPGTTNYTGTSMNNADGIASNDSITFTRDNLGNLNITNANAAADIIVQHDDSSSVTLSSFQDFYVNLGANDPTGSVVNISNSNTGRVVLGGGDDSLTITPSSGGGASNIFNIETGGGNDSVSLISGGGNKAIFNVNTGIGNDTVTLTGSHNSANIDTGAGNDIITFSIGKDTLQFGLGYEHDSLTGSTDVNDYVHLTLGSTATIVHNTGFNWTVSLGGHTAVISDNYNATMRANSLDFNTNNASGTITMDDGSVLNFTGLEHITW